MSCKLEDRTVVIDSYSIEYFMCRPLRLW